MFATMIGRTAEQDFFTEHVLRPVEPAYNLLSMWGEAGVGKSTLLARFQDMACSIEFKEACLTALVDAWLLTPVRLMECVAVQLRGAGAPLVAFERVLARYKETARHQQEEQEVASLVFLRRFPSLVGDGIRGKPVIGSFYSAVAEESSDAFWRERDVPRLDRMTAFASDALTWLTHAFIEDLNWLTAAQELRVILFFDGIEPSCVEIVNWLRDHLLAANMSKNVVLVVAGHDSMTQALADQRVLYSMPLARFNEDETRQYLAERGIIEASRCNTIWQVSGGLPLALSLLALDHEIAIDTREDASASALRWLSRQQPLEQQLVLHTALFSGSFQQDDLAAFRFLPESEQEQTRLYRWLIALPFVQHSAVDGRHRYHDLAREWFSHTLEQRSEQAYQSSRRMLANYYWRQLAHFQEDGQHISASVKWLEVAQALVWQLLSLADVASHASAIEQVLEIAHRAKRAEDIVPLLRTLSLSNLVNADARTLAGQLLDYLEADLASAEFLAAASALIDRLSQAWQPLQAGISRSSHGRIYGKRGMAYLLREEYQRAVEDCDHALSLDPIYGEAYLLRGIAFSTLSEYQRAISDFTRALALGSRDVYAYAHRGMAYRERKNYGQALADLDQALALDPQVDEIVLLRNLTYGQFNEAGRGLGDFDHTLELNPDDAQAYVSRGMAYCALGEYRRAIEDLDLALSLNPNDAQAFAGRGHVYLEMGDIERAQDDLSQSRALEADDVHTGLLLEWTVLCQDGPQPDTATRLEAIAAENPRQYAAYICRGVALLLHERFEEALAELEQALLLDTSKGHAYFWKALTCAFLGRDEEAAAALERARTAELPLPEVLFAPLRWLEHRRSDFYQQHVLPVLGEPEIESSSQRA